MGQRWLLIFDPEHVPPAQGGGGAQIQAGPAGRGLAGTPSSLVGRAPKSWRPEASAVSTSPGE